ncbi:MAG: Transcriptional regulator, ArsR family (Modular protein) [Nitrospira sp.]|nr:MAG: Transcriptional regulator, ArsR family (Modular protein) [Nitrospira sp.]
MKRATPNKTTTSQECAAILRAMGDPTRLAILESLLAQEKCVGDLVAELNRPQPYISHHLRILRQAGLIEGQRDGKQICYRIAPHMQSTLKRRGEQGLDFGCCQLNFPTAR